MELRRIFIVNITFIFLLILLGCNKKSSSSEQFSQVQEDSEIIKKKFENYKEKLYAKYQPKYIALKEGQKVRILDKFNFASSGWRMVFFPNTYYGGINSFLQERSNLVYGIIPKDTLKLLLQNQVSYLKQEQDTIYPCRELMDSSLMLKMQKDFTFSFKSGIPSTPSFTFLVFKDNELMFQSNVHITMGEIGFLSDKYGYIYTKNKNVILNYLRKFKPIAYNPIYFWTGKSIDKFLK